MTSKEALDWFKRQEKRQNNGNGDLWLKMYINAIEQDLEILEIIKKRLNYHEGYYKNQADWSREEFWFNLESDNIWLNEEQREQYKKEFNTLKEWYLKEVKDGK